MFAVGTSGISSCISDAIAGLDCIFPINDDWVFSETALADEESRCVLLCPVVNNVSKKTGTGGMGKQEIKESKNMDLIFILAQQFSMSTVPLLYSFTLRDMSPNKGYIAYIGWSVGYIQAKSNFHFLADCHYNLSL